MPRRFIVLLVDLSIVSGWLVLAALAATTATIAIALVMTPKGLVDATQHINQRYGNDTEHHNRLYNSRSRHIDFQFLTKEVLQPGRK